MTGVTVKKSMAQALLPGPRTGYLRGMNLRCLFRHRPMLTSIVKQSHAYTALCDSCGVPIERTEEGRWTASAPLISRRDEAA